MRRLNWEVLWIIEKVSQNGKWSLYDARRQEQENRGQEVESQEALLYKPPAQPPFCKVNRGKMQWFLVVMATPRIPEVYKIQNCRNRLQGKGAGQTNKKLSANDTS